MPGTSMRTPAILSSLLLLMLAVPSLEGVLADKRLRRSLDRFNDLVRQAQERSVADHRAYLIVWRDKGVSLAFTSIRHALGQLEAR